MTPDEIEALLTSLKAAMNSFEENSQFIRHAANHLVAVAERLQDIATRVEQKRRIHDIDELKRITDDLLQRNDRMKQTTDQMKQIMDLKVAAVNPMPESLSDRVRRLEKIVINLVNDIHTLKTKRETE
jgi:methyl-accepting chemotaxis protein